LFRIWLWLRHRVFGRRFGRLVLENVEGVPLVVLPDVFNPVLLRTGAILARAASRVYGNGAGEGTRALDKGTGSGTGAVAAAKQGFTVVAVDINPEAVRCARINVLMNHLEGKIEVREGDLFAPVQGERFDLVLFNPPFFRGIPQNTRDLAWRSPDVIERFAAALPRHLTPEGRALVVLSTDGEENAMLEALSRAGLHVTIVSKENLGNEVVTVYSAGVDRRG
jgi:release factor glutamine methyltransferase